MGLITARHKNGNCKWNAEAINAIFSIVENNQHLHRVAAQRGGKCLSTDYTDSKTPLEWECAEGHRWKSTATTILKGNGGKGSWCKQCWLNNVSSVMRSYRASLPWVNAND